MSVANRVTQDDLDRMLPEDRAKLENKVQQPMFDKKDKHFARRFGKFRNGEQENQR